MNEGTRVEVEIFGEYYVVKGDYPREYVLEVARYVNEKMHLLAKRNPRLSPAKLAVLAALNIADELTRLRADYEQLLEMIEKA
ncbi:MAG: cell division protein ZapA [Firmicutes bacterium]|nr:cell division protein ZapA [Bacillota bacterium]